MSIRTKVLGGALLGATGLVTMGLLALPVAGTASADAVKREDDVVELVLVADDDDDDTNDRTMSRDTRSANTGISRATRDHTRSNFTLVSRDRDLSRSDKTRDWTDDGLGPKKRDWSAGSTNDRSRNDTRR